MAIFSDIISVSEHRALLARAEFEKLVNERLLATKRTAVLQDSIDFVQTPGLVRLIRVEIEWYREHLKNLDGQLDELRKELGIETPTSNEGTL